MRHPRRFAELVTEDVPELEEEDAVLLLKMIRAAEMCPWPCWPDHTRYLEMSWLERRAWIVAAQKREGLHAQRIGLASLGPLGAALSGADGDGGAAAEAVFLEQQIAATLSNIERESHVP